MERKGGLQEEISAAAEMLYRSQSSNGSFGANPSSLEFSVDYNPSHSLACMQALNVEQYNFARILQPLGNVKRNTRYISHLGPLEETFSCLGSLINRHDYWLKVTVSCLTLLSVFTKEQLYILRSSSLYLVVEAAN